VVSYRKETYEKFTKFEPMSSKSQVWTIVFNRKVW